MSLASGQILRSDHINQILRALKEATSVISGLSVEPTSPASMNVIVRAGTAIIGGSVVSLASDTTVSISTPDSSYPRFDLITLKSNGTVGYYVGTPESAVAVDLTKPETYVKPKPPSTPAGEVALAEVFVPAGATAIDKIIDRRIVTGLSASQVTSGRFSMSRMPDGGSGKVLVAQGVGVDPAYVDPNFNLIQVGGTALTGRDWSGDLAKLQNIDVLLSSRASEATLSAMKNALASVGTDKFRVSVVDAIPESPFNITKIAGTALTARDWSSDFAKLQNLDVLLSTRASETTLGGIKTQTDKLTFDASNYLQVNVKATVNPSNLDVTLSTRASESTLSGLSGKFPSAVALADNLSNPTTTIIGVANLGWDGTYWRRLATDTSSRLRTIVESVANPSNLDVALSTRASESTLSGLSGKFPTSVALADNLANPTTTIIGAANLGFDGTYWRRIVTDTSGRMKVALDSIPNPSNLDVALSTRASEATLSAIKNALASVGTDKIRASIVDSLPAGTNKIGSVDVASLPNPSNLDVALSTRASEATLKTLRWGRDVSPSWVHGNEVTAPAAGTALVSKTVSSGKSGYVYGFFISAGEANDFKINWTSGGAAKSVRIPFSSKGAVQYVDFEALNEGLPADGGTSITITNVNAGSSGVVYQARLLYVEV